MLCALCWPTSAQPLRQSVCFLLFRVFVSFSCSSLIMSMSFFLAFLSPAFFVLPSCSCRSLPSSSCIYIRTHLRIIALWDQTACMHLRQNIYGRRRHRSIYHRSPSHYIVKHLCTLVHTCAHLCTLVHTCAHLCTLLHAHMCAPLHTCSRMCTIVCAHMCTLVHTCAHVCMQT